LISPGEHDNGIQPSRNQKEKLDSQSKSGASKESKSALVRYATMGTQMVAVMLIFSFGGHKLDQWLHFKVPILTIVLSLFGVFMAIYLVVKDLLKKN